MLRIETAVLSLGPEEVLELERIVVDDDREGSLAFLKRSVYRKLLNSQQGRLKSHMDGTGDPVDTFKKGM